MIKKEETAKKVKAAYDLTPKKYMEHEAHQLAEKYLTPEIVDEMSVEALSVVITSLYNARSDGYWEARNRLF